MSSSTLPRRILSLFLFAAFGTFALAKSESKFTALGENTFAITRIATTGFDRDVGKFTEEAKNDAAKYCAEKGKTLKLVTVTSERPHYGGGFSWAKVVFKALDAGDPALTAPETARTLTAASAPAVEGVLPTYAGDMYSELLKLDDLRKRGLLTDKEFEQQKKKLLKKSK